MSGGGRKGLSILNKIMINFIFLDMPARRADFTDLRVVGVHFTFISKACVQDRWSLIPAVLQPNI
jgi:hypothetical protein